MDLHTSAVAQRQSRTQLDGRGGSPPVEATRLISRLPDREVARLMPLLQRVELAPRQVLHYRNLPLEHVYFIERGLISVMAKVSDRDWVEAWLVGSEGTTGVPVMLGDAQPPLRRVVQIGGTALRMPVAAFRSLLERSEPFRHMLLRYTQVVLLQSSQCGVCNAQHSMRQRLARWLLLARDGLQAVRIAVPHQALARLMGVRRATISECLKDIEARGAIRTGRRLIEVAEPDTLERCACDCYRIIRRERQRLLGL
jgi:CRP-like cAMP-binding protein